MGGIINFMLDERVAPTKEEKWVDGQALKDFGIGVKDKINKSAESKLDKGAVSEDYNSAKKIEDKIKALESRPQGEFLEKGGYDGTAQTLKEYTDTKVAGLVNSAPETLDTLKELSEALGNDPNFATTVTNKIGTKLEKGNYSGTAQDLKTLIDGKLDKGEVSEDYNTAKKIEDKIKEGMKVNIIGTINNEATLNQAKGNGWYKVNNYWINNMYGYGFLYAYTHEQTTQQIFFSHRGGIAWRQDWNSNISEATWQKIGGDLDTKLDKGNYVGTAQDLKNEINGKLSNSGGTINGNLTVTGTVVTNSSISAKSLILNGYTITIEV